MNWTHPLVATAVLAAALVTGCAAAGAGQPTASGCATSAVQALRAGGSLASLPRPCRRLGPAALDQAVRIVVATLANDGDKAVRRHLAGRVRARLAVLISAQQVAARHAAHRAAARLQARRTASPRAQGKTGSQGVGIPVRLAALLAWLLTAASGSVLLVKWRMHTGRHAGPGSGRPPPAVLISHAGLAAGGLLTWSGYLVTRAPALAWIALGVLLPVAGLGIAALVHAIPDAAPATGEAGEPASHAIGWPATATALVTASAPPRARRPSVVMIVVHGVLATTTILLALLAAIAALGLH